MTQSNSSTLRVDRLVVFSNGKRVYDEPFHNGVNIIRGSNSSGKSTIANFLFFSLGGDFNKWTPEAEKCDYAYVQISVNDAILTLKREVTKKRQQGMSIYYGKFDDGIKHVDGWKLFPFRQTREKRSFSQILFNALGLPPVKEDESNITMHQILRLLYVDQQSKSLSLLYEEIFDKPLVRDAIGDLLYGVYDDSLYTGKRELEDAKKELEDVKSQLKSISRIFEENGSQFDLSSINKEIEDKGDELERLHSILSDYDSTEQIEDGTPTDEIESLREKYLNFQKEYIEKKNSLQFKEADIDDSRLFIQTLESNLKALEEANVTRESLITLDLPYCPKCLSPIKKTEDGTICSLCKQTLSIQPQGTGLLRMKQELLFQISESKSHFEKKKKEWLKLKNDLPQLRENVSLAKVNLDEKLNKVRTKRDKRLDDLLIKQGQLESDLVMLHKQAKSFVIIDELKQNQIKQISIIKDKGSLIKSKKDRQIRRKQQAVNTVESIAKELLKSDLPREDDFQNPKEILVDFHNNTFYVNGRNSVSDSSKVYLKNCIHYAIFFASLELLTFRYPRFILCDDMEDKGMEESRSQNFQKTIVKFSKKYSNDFQIIFTTSMIDPSLDKNPPCVGDKYSRENKSVKM